MLEGDIAILPSECFGSTDWRTGVVSKILIFTSFIMLMAVGYLMMFDNIFLQPDPTEGYLVIKLDFRLVLLLTILKQKASSMH